MTVPIPECLGITEEDVREALKLIVALRLAALKRGIPVIATRVALKVRAAKNALARAEDALERNLLELTIINIAEALGQLADLAEQLIKDPELLKALLEG